MGVAIVLAGGASRRFGRDKLAEDLGGATLLDTVLAGLPDDVAVIVVGPKRALNRQVGWVREDPPGGGPAAALITGLRAALARGAEIIWVLPGDAPGAGAAAAELDQALQAQSAAAAVVALDSDGRVQPLQLALRRTAAEQLVRAGGASGGHDAAARGLVEALDPPARRHRVQQSGSVDIDTPEQLRTWWSLQSAESPATHLRNTERA